jgi:hypothetical protein
MSSSQGSGRNVMTDAEVQIRSKVKMVGADENLFGVLSTRRANCSRVSAALVLDRYDLLQMARGHDSPKRYIAQARNGPRPRCAFNVPVGNQEPSPVSTVRSVTWKRSGEPRNGTGYSAEGSPHLGRNSEIFYYTILYL